MMKLTKIIPLFLLTFAICLSKFVLASPNPSKPFPPFHIVDNLYYVGNDFQASYLIVTPQGNILINSDYEHNVPLIKESIKKLGFNYNDIKILLISHAHSDHAGGSALIKKQTGATYMVMDADVPVIESGGKADFHYGDDLTERYLPTKVDKILHDGDQVKLGDRILVAHLTAGHTKGNTTWTMQVKENGETYQVVILGSTGINPGYKLINNSAYPTIAKDYVHMFNTLKTLPCDIFLGSHGMYFGLEDKYALLNESKNEVKSNPFIDPAGYIKYVGQKEMDFQKELNKQEKVQ